MSDLPKALTIGEIRRRTGAENHQIQHVIATRRIKPVARAGNANIYSEQDAQFIESELGRIARERLAVHA